MNGSNRCVHSLKITRTMMMWHLFFFFWGIADNNDSMKSKGGIKHANKKIATDFNSPFLLSACNNALLRFQHFVCLIRYCANFCLHQMKKKSRCSLVQLYRLQCEHVLSECANIRQMQKIISSQLLICRYFDDMKWLPQSNIAKQQRRRRRRWRCSNSKQQHKQYYETKM